MVDKLQRKGTARQRPDSSPFLPPAYPTGPKYSASPYSSGIPVSEGPNALDVSAQGSHALNNATALLSAGRHLADEKNAKDKSAASPASQQNAFNGRMPGIVGSTSSLPSNHYNAPRNNDNISNEDAGYNGAYASAGQPMYGHNHGMLSRQTVDREMVGDHLLMTLSLLDPHPIIVPPPGSRLAFAGATSRETAHTFRSLPSLEDTLLRRARAPLCLYNYWQYLLEIECRPEELEFWLSLSDYEVLYRRYANLRSPSIGPIGDGNTQERAHIPTMGPTGKRLRYGRVESGALGSQSVHEAMTSGGRLTLPKRRSGPVDNLDTEAQELDAYLATLSYQTVLAAKESRCQIHRPCTRSQCPFTSAHRTSRPTLDAPARPAQHHGLHGFFSRIFSGEPGMRSGATYKSEASEAQDIPLLSPSASEAKDEALDTPTRDDMRYAVDRLYSYYFSPGAPAQLYISSQMRDEIATRVETDGRLDSDLFAPAKRHAYEAMHNESYLRFLRERLYHNITRGTAAPRIALGLSLIFVALAFQFSLIFLDVTPKGWRWLPLAAMWPGFVYAFAGVSRLDPFMALLGRYEPKAWHFESVQDSAIRDSHLKRGSMQLIFAAAIAAIITLVLFLVPGHHL